MSTDRLTGTRQTPRSDAIAVRARRVLSRTVNILLLGYTVVSLYPFAWMIYSSSKTTAEFALNVFSLPSRIRIDNYATVFKDPLMFSSLFASAFNSILSIAGIVVSSFVVGYFLARYRFRGRNLLYSFFLFGLLVPVHALMIPVFILFRMLGMLNNRFTLLLPYIAFGLSSAVFLMDGFIQTIPKEMEEAAFVDGSSLPVTLVRIIFPICTPIVATIVILGFLGSWNEFAFALVLIRSHYLKTVPRWLNTFNGQYTVNYPLKITALIVASLPVVIIYLLFSCRIMEGMSAGALKG